MENPVLLLSYLGNSCNLCFVFCSFFLTSLTQTNCCHTWIPQISPAAATMTFCHSLKTTERLSGAHTLKLLLIAWGFPEKLPQLLRTRSTQRCTPFLFFLLYNFHSPAQIDCKESQKKLKGHGRIWRHALPTSCDDNLDCAATYSSFYFYTTRVYVCSPITCCSISKILFFCFLLKLKNELTV